jgi:hypothetical protein
VTLTTLSPAPPAFWVHENVGVAGAASNDGPPSTVASEGSMIQPPSAEPASVETLDDDEHPSRTATLNTHLAIPRP